MIWALHGNLGDPGDWAATAGCLAPVRVSTPGLWEPLPEGFHLWAKVFLDRVAGDSAGPRVLMGYSLGARLAMHALLERPECWAAAVFVSGHPGLRKVEERLLRLRDDLAWASRLRSWGDENFLSAWNAQPVFAGGAAPAAQLSRLRQHRKAIAAAFDRWSLGRQEFLGARLQACAVPQLWVAGKQDPRFAAFAADMARNNGNATAVMIEDCGHRLPLQKPRELAECVRTFLESAELGTENVDTSC